MLNGSTLLANALALRTGFGSLELQAEAERQRAREEAAGTRQEAEAARRELLEGSIPVLLRILPRRPPAAGSACEASGGGEADEASEPGALAAALDALRKLASSPAAVGSLLRHGALSDTLETLRHWPKDASATEALDASELARLLLLATAAPPSPEDAADADGAQAAEEVDRPASSGNLDPLGRDTAEQTAARVARVKERLTPTAGKKASPADEPTPEQVEAEHLAAAAAFDRRVKAATGAATRAASPSAVAAHAGDRLADLLGWVGSVSVAHAVAGTISAEEKLQVREQRHARPAATPAANPAP